MSSPNKIIDGHGSGDSLRISPEGAAQVVVHPHPPLVDDLITIPFRQFFTDDGLSSGSNDMKVDGSTNNVDFFIAASQTKDVFIKSISIVIADAGATLNEFGNLAALTNGLTFSHVTGKEGETVVADDLKTNFDFVRMSLGSPAFGDGTAAFRANNVSGTSEAYIPVIDFAILFGMPWGVRLRKGTKDKLVFTVKDDVQTVDDFNIIGFGVLI